MSLTMRRWAVWGVVAAAIGLAAGAAPAVETEPVSPDALARQMEAMTRDVTQGALRIRKKDGSVVECPLRRTDVQADVSGFLARVKVTQVFFNPLDEKIEAVYVFPLPHKAAVDDMTMVIGERRILGRIKRRAEARALYEQALAQGLTAALLEQERPNIFTQSVGNIEPRQEVRIEISYIDVLEYDMGVYEFHFPMVVGPRYIPGSPTSAVPPVPVELQGKVGELDRTKVPEGPAKPQGTGWSPDTDRVPDASRITPPVLKPGLRNGHDIGLEVRLEAGVPLQDLKVTSHEAAIERTGKSQARVRLSPADAIPNKAFVLRYAVVGRLPEMAVLHHTDRRGLGYFMLMVQPADDERVRQTPPREIVFLVDVSGSMSGQPTAKVIDAMQRMLKLCKAEDTVQVITFANQTRKVFEAPVPVTEETIGQALKFTEGLKGGGGTEMLKGIQAAINEPLDEKRVRIVIMLTDGYIGNEAEIIAEVGRRCGDRIRFWAVGIGSDPNRFLLEGVARQGGGMAKVLGLPDDAQPLVQEIMFRIHRAQLADVRVEWGGQRVFDTYPAKIPELWAGRPIVLFGLYDGGSSRKVTINVRGDVEGDPVSWPIEVVFPANQKDNEVLARVWARHKIEDLMQQTFYAGSPEVEEAVTALALEYRLMSQYTSFVAVDEKDLGRLREPARPPRRMPVPVPLPEGTRFEGFFVGEGVSYAAARPSMELKAAMSAAPPGEPVSLGADRSYGLQGGGAAPADRKPAGPAGAWGRGVAGQPMLRGRPAMAGARPAAPAQAASKRFDPSGLAAGAYLFGKGAAAADALSRLGLHGSLGLGEAGPLADWDVGYTQHALTAPADPLTAPADPAAKRAAEVLKEARALLEKGDRASARARFALAYLLDAAAMAVGRSGGATSAAALAGLEQADAALRKDWAKAMPGLDRTLDRVLRDQTVAEALETVGADARLKVRLLPGSTEDAAALLGVKDVRITYLDLRNATAAQALDWVLVPLRMTWWVEGGAVVAGTSRRGPGASAWVYDVSLLALPSAKDLDEIEDRAKRLEAAKKAAEGFLAPVRKALGAGEAAVLWYGAGHLLVVGDAARHAAAAKLFADLADPKAALAVDLAELHQTTSRRAAERQDAAAAILAAAEKARVAQALDEFSWRLVAGAARGERDTEALTELQVAWRHPAVADLLRIEPTDNRKTPYCGQMAALLMRSLWALAEAARAMPKEPELAALEKAARAKAGPAGPGLLAVLEKSPDDATAYLGVLYLVLSGEGGEFAAKAKATLLAPREEPAMLAALWTVAEALLVPAKDINAKALAERFAQGAAGDDLVVLTAMACRRAGGAVWEEFRAEAADLLGRQPLHGSVVVLVNSLSRPAPVLAAGP